MEQSTKRRVPLPNQETKDDSQEAGTSPRETPLVEMMAEGTDPTEQGRLEAQLTQSTNMLFLRTMALDIAAHELRSSLAIILGTIQLMLEPPDGNQLHIECANRVQAATKYASMMLENSLQSTHPLHSDMVKVDITANAGEKHLSPNPADASAKRHFAERIPKQLAQSFRQSCGAAAGFH